MAAKWTNDALTALTDLAVEFATNREIYVDTDPGFDAKETLSGIVGEAIASMVWFNRDEVAAEDVENAVGHWFRGEVWAA